MTDFSTPNPAAALLAAALAIPVTAGDALAETSEANREIGFKYLYYTDKQSSGQRMQVRAPTLWLNTPVGPDGEFSGTVALDSMSGASALYLNTLSGASGKGVRDVRRNLDAKYTHHFERAAIGVAATVSGENDYLSRSVALDGRLESEDRNTTWAAGMAWTSDDITSDINPSFQDGRFTRDWFFGVTQVVSPVALLQANLSFSEGRGYFSDPYKPLDTRPRDRNKTTALLRLRYHVPEWNGTLHADYRYYRDSWAVRGHSVDLAWHQPLADGWQVSPSLRLYSQDQASFYFNSFPPARFGMLYSADSRLASFGSITFGLKVAKLLADGYTVELAVDQMQQRSAWHWGGNGTPGVEPFYARWITVGVRKAF